MSKKNKLAFHDWQNSIREEKARESALESTIDAISAIKYAARNNSIDWNVFAKKNKIDDSRMLLIREVIDDFARGMYDID